MTIPAPERSLAQRRRALAEGNRIRTYRSALKRDLKAGRASALTLLADPPPDLATMKAWDLLIAVPKVGRVKVNRAFVVCRVSPSKTLGGMTDRQRRELASALSLGAAVQSRGGGS